MVRVTESKRRCSPFAARRKTPAGCAPGLLVTRAEGRRPIWPPLPTGRLTRRWLVGGAQAMPSPTIRLISSCIGQLKSPLYCVDYCAISSAISSITYTAACVLATHIRRFSLVVGADSVPQVEGTALKGPTAMPRVMGPDYLRTAGRRRCCISCRSRHSGSQKRDSFPVCATSAVITPKRDSYAPIDRLKMTMDTRADRPWRRAFGMVHAPCN